MNAERQAKNAQVKEIYEKISASKSLIVAEYAGLKVTELQALRRDLQQHGVELKVYKNRLFKIATKKTEFDFAKSLVGPNIYAFGMEDDISPAKILFNFAKNHEALKIKIGTYEGKVIDASELALIATLPTFDEALTILAMSLLAPLRYVGVGLKMLTDENKINSTAEDAAETKVGDEDTKESSSPASTENNSDANNDSKETEAPESTSSKDETPNN